MERCCSLDDDDQRMASPEDDHWYRDRSIEWTRATFAELWERCVLGPRRHMEERWVFAERRALTREEGPHNHENVSSALDTRYEAGYGWTLGIDCFSTGMNGTCHKIFTVPYDDTRGADAVARDIIEYTCDWPGWRTIYVTGSSQGFQVQLYGGRYEWGVSAASTQAPYPQATATTPMTRKRRRRLDERT